VQDAFFHFIYGQITLAYKRRPPQLSTLTSVAG